MAYGDIPVRTKLRYGFFGHPSSSHCWICSGTLLPGPRLDQLYYLQAPKLPTTKVRYIYAKAHVGAAEDPSGPAAKSASPETCMGW